MPRYIGTQRLNPSYFQGLLQNPSDRMAVLQPIFESAGATLEHVYLSPETMEGVQIWTCDDPARLDRVLLSAAASGALDLSTYSIRRILTGAELAETARAVDPSAYRPPGA